MPETCKGHDKHMCELSKEKNLDAVKKFAKGAAYVCAGCGRAAAKPENLCRPEKI